MESYAPGHAPGAGCSRSAPLAGARAALRRLLHGAPRRHDHDRGAALDRGRSRLREARPAVGAERLRPHLRRPALARRTRGRPARTPACVHGRCPGLHGRVAHVRARLVTGGAPRGPRGAGRRRRDHDADRPVDHLHHVHGGLRAEQGARDLGRARRHRRHRGVADRRPARRRPRLAPCRSARRSASPLSRPWPSPAPRTTWQRTKERTRSSRRPRATSPPSWPAPSWPGSG